MSIIYHLPEELKQEFSVDESGKAYASQSAIARLCGVSQQAINKLLTQISSTTSNLPKSLKPFSGNDYMGTTKVPDIVVAAIIEYYSFDARQPKEQSQLVYRAFATIGFRTWVQDELEYKEPSVESMFEVHQPVTRVKPEHTMIEYAQAAVQVQSLPDGILKQLIYDGLTDELSLQQNLKYLPVAEKPKQYTIVKVRAKQLGYTDKQIGSGTGLGKFVKRQISPAFQEQVGRFAVYHYEINQDLDSAIHTFFS